MYGTARIPYPRRVVCLTPDTADTVLALGAGDRVVGVGGTVRWPPTAGAGSSAPTVTELAAEAVAALRPDLTLAGWGTAPEMVRDLLRAGVAVLALSPLTLADVYRGVLLVGGVLGCEVRARELVQDLEDELRQVREYSSVWPDRPRVYVEEPGDPPRAAVAWVSELVEAAGGQDVFAEFRGLRDPQARQVEPAEVMRRDPDLIVLATAGAPADPDAVARARGWQDLRAVRAGQVHPVPAEDLLVPGPSLLRGLRTLHELIQGCVAEDR